MHTTDDDIKRALKSFSADYLMNEDDEYCQAEAIRRVAEVVERTERDRWIAIVRKHMDMAERVGAREKARAAASILAEGYA